MEPWHIRLFKKSIVKQVKYGYLRDFMGDYREKRCLDLGADNGVISYLFRKDGGSWASADIDADAVASIRNLVEKEVYLFDGLTLPFPGESFDLIVIVDLLEHVHEDRKLLEALSRILKSDGILIINVPHVKRFSFIRFFRDCIGLTDEQHGHVRQGYTLAQLQGMLPGYHVTRHATYSKFFLEWIDVLVAFPFHVLNKGKANKKGVLVTEDKIKKYEKLFLVYSLLYPFMWVFAQLDFLLFFLSGYRLIVRAVKQ